MADHRGDDHRHRRWRVAGGAQAVDRGRRDIQAAGLEDHRHDAGGQAPSVVSAAACRWSWAAPAIAGAEVGQAAQQQEMAALVGADADPARNSALAAPKRATNPGEVDGVAQAWATAMRPRGSAERRLGTFIGGTRAAPAAVPPRA